MLRDVREDKVHLTYLFHPTHILWICRSLWEPLMVLTELYVTSHPLWPLPWNSWCSRDAGITNDVSQHRVGAQAVTRCAQVGTTWQPWRQRKGCCTTPTNTPTCYQFIRNSHTVRVKCAGALSCLNHTCYITPLLLGSGITQLHI